MIDSKIKLEFGPLQYLTRIKRKSLNTTSIKAANHLENLNHRISPLPYTTLL